jgi:CBS domain-containing protein
MSAKYGNQSGGNSDFSTGDRLTGTVRRGEAGSDSPNFGSARSDYGSRAYGGSSDESGLGERDTAITSTRGGYSGRKGGGRFSRGAGISSSGVMLLVGGLGLGGALAYIFGSGKVGRGRLSAGRKEVMVKCGEVMTENPACCLPSDAVDRAAQLMRAEDVGPVPVVADHQSKSLVGIVTDRDLAIKVVADGRDPKSTRVSEVMTTGVATCRREDDLQRALSLMEQHQVRRIPIVDEGRRIVGIIAQADVATRTEAPQETARVVEEVSKASAAGAR